jgi:hypothetical protein
MRGIYKLLYFFGYEEYSGTGEHLELYDIQNDPEELNNLYPEEQGLGRDLLNEVKEKLAQVNAPYEQ